MPHTSKSSESETAIADELSKGVGKRRARPWHRRLGILLALPLMWVVITGAPLGHTVDWKLDQRMVDHPWVLMAYGMKPKGSPCSIQLGERMIASWDGQVFLDGKIIASGELVSALKDGEGVAVVLADGVMRLDRQGDLLESLGSESLPALPLSAAGQQDGIPLLRNSEGWHRMLNDWLEFEKIESAQVNIIKAAPLEDEEMIKRLRRSWAGGGLPMSRVILDLHAGRFLGPLAAYFYDIVALSTVILCVSGIILFYRKPRRGVRS